jgi:hypothetical protein
MGDEEANPLSLRASWREMIFSNISRLVTPSHSDPSYSSTRRRGNKVDCLAVEVPFVLEAR